MKRNELWKKKIGDVHLQFINVTLCGIPMLGNNYAVDDMLPTCEKCKELNKQLKENK